MCWLRLIITVTFSSGMISVAVGVFPFAFLPATDISPARLLQFDMAQVRSRMENERYRPPYGNLIRDVRNRRPDNEVLHIRLHASDLAMLPFHYTSDLVDSHFQQNGHGFHLGVPVCIPRLTRIQKSGRSTRMRGTQSSSSTVPVTSSMPMSSDISTEYFVSTTYPIKCTNIGTSGRGRRG